LVLKLLPSRKGREYVVWMRKESDISFVFTGAGITHIAVSLCTLLAKLIAGRCFVCMCLPAYEVEKEMREM
jgi:hypothetical protein